MNLFHTCLLSSIISFATTLQADQKKADELLEVMQVKEQMVGGFDAMMPVIDQMAVQMNLTPEAKTELIGIYKAWFAEDLDQDKMVNEIVALYADAFTVEEMDALIAFYKSPLGQKFLELSPELMKKGAQIGMDEATRKQQQLLNRLQPFLERQGLR